MVINPYCLNDLPKPVKVKTKLIRILRECANSFYNQNHPETLMHLGQLIEEAEEEGLLLYGESK